VSSKISFGFSALNVKGKKEEETRFSQPLINPFKDVGKSEGWKHVSDPLFNPFKELGKAEGFNKA
jgi:hypothetical protein